MDPASSEEVVTIRCCSFRKVGKPTKRLLGTEPDLITLGNRQPRHHVRVASCKKCTAYNAKRVDGTNTTWNGRPRVNCSSGHSASVHTCSKVHGGENSSTKWDWFITLITTQDSVLNVIGHSIILGLLLACIQLIDA
jgi:hypothetical protein